MKPLLSLGTGILLVALFPPGAFPAGQPFTNILQVSVTPSSGSYGISAPSVIAVSDPTVPFTTAVEITVPSAGTAIYSSAAIWNTVATVTQGDLLVANFYIRNRNQNSALLRVAPVFELSTSPYTASLFTNAPVDDGIWHQYSIPFYAVNTMAAGTASLQLQCGTAAQTFDVGGIEVLDYGPQTSVPSALQSTFAFYYPGRGKANASWRVQAQQNIAKYRMADLEIKVIDQHGVRTSGVPVAIKQTNSAFLWGTAIDGTHVQANTDLSPSNYQHYTQNVLANFNLVVCENDMKWPQWAASRQPALNALNWAKMNSLTVRGHNLIWPSFANMPSSTAGLNASALTSAIDAHFQDEAGALKGEVYSWDVVNEPYSNYQVQGQIAAPGVTQSNGILGNNAIVQWYQMVRQIDPAVRLELNDYFIFEAVDPIHRGYDLALVQYLESNGAELDDLNFESHFSQNVPVFPDMDESISMFSPYVQHFGVTEFDFSIIDPSLQQDMTADFMTYVFGQPMFDHFLMWGFWDGASWIKNAPLYNLDWSLKPSGQAFQTLTQQTWRTNVSGTTSKFGSYQTKAFLGSYQVTLGTGGQACTFNVELPAAREITVHPDCSGMTAWPASAPPPSNPPGERKPASAGL